MDKLQAMAVFVQIAERGSLTAAAEVLDKSLPSVVRILASLEENLQTRLFNRTTRRIALTEEGRTYLESCRRLLADIDDAESALGQDETEPRGMITVTAPVRFGEMHVAPAVTRFLQHYTQVQVRLLLLDRVIDMLEEGVDVAVRIAPLTDSSLVAKPVGRIRQVVCASPKLIQEVGKPGRPKELAELPCIRFTGISSGSVWHFFRDGKPVPVSVNGSLSCNQVNPAVNACIAGLGFGMFLCYQVMPAVRRGELELVLTDFEPDPLPLSLVFPHRRLSSTRLRIFVDWMAEAIPESLQANERVQS
ncbi:MAG: LysR family transcriptional regulator [Chromatiaceae bacterium]|nr:LysR family transcriptional regulator [Chromatiaceae bacterium]MCP5443951.1 LysR family transcriptional regulator [Chromatiaceae bacterium]